MPQVYVIERYYVLHSTVIDGYAISCRGASLNLRFDPKEITFHLAAAYMRRNLLGTARRHWLINFLLSTTMQ